MVHGLDIMILLQLNPEHKKVASRVHLKAAALPWIHRNKKSPE